jgi:hypothetical protein
MFRSVVSGLHRRFPGHVRLFQLYLERHIEVDGDSHDPMALKMISELCGSDKTLGGKQRERQNELSMRALHSGPQFAIESVFHGNICQPLTDNSEFWRVAQSKLARRIWCRALRF